MTFPKMVDRQMLGKIKSQFFVLGLAAMFGFTSMANAQSLDLITKDSGTGEAMSGHSYEVSISADGRYTAFVSTAMELPGPIYRYLPTVYVYDRTTDNIEHINIVGESGQALSGGFKAPYISADGRFVAVIRNLGNNDESVYVYDRQSETQEVIFQSEFTASDSHFERQISLSDDGNLVVFETDYPILGAGSEGLDVVLYDRQAQSFELLSKRNDGSNSTNRSHSGQISGDGKFAVFHTSDTAMDAPDSRSGLFRRDLTTDTNLAIAYDGSKDDGTTQKVTSSYITSDGAFVAYTAEIRNSQTNDFISWNTYLWSVDTQTTRLISEDFWKPTEEPIFFNGIGQPSRNVSVSDDGTKVLFSAPDYSPFSYTWLGEPQSYQAMDNVFYIYDTVADTKKLVATGVGDSTYQGDGYWEVSYYSYAARQQISRDGGSMAFSSLTHYTDDRAPNFNIFSGSTQASSNPPIADAGPDVIFRNGKAYPDGLGSTDDITPSANLSYQWEFVGFPSMYDSISLENPNSATPTVTGSGGIVMKLTVRDEDGLFSAYDYVFLESNFRPIAKAGADQTTVTGQLVTLNADESFDYHGDELTYHWTLSGKPASSQISLDSTNVQFDFTPDVAGTYQARLTVNDGETDSKEDIVKITVLENPADAVQSLQNARDTIAAMNASDLPWSTGRARILQFLDDAIFQIGKDRPLMARAYLNKARQRVDGCARRGAPDERDWVKTCEAQSSVHPDLNTAWDILITY